MTVQASEKAGQALSLFRALGGGTRLRLIERLREGEQCACDLTDELGASQSRLSFHLKALKDAGVVTDRKEGAEAFTLMHRLVENLKPVQRSFHTIRKVRVNVFVLRHQPELVNEIAR